MPTFDIVSELDMHEITNAVDQANREVGTRFDFKGSDAEYERKDNVVTLRAQSEFQLEQMLDILYNKLTRRSVDIKCAKVDEPQTVGRTAHQILTLRHGIDAPLARQLVKQIKDSKIKVQASVQGDQVRVSGKKRDDLQAVIALLRKTETELPLQFVNFRD
ncbi:MAG: YajQ family cyclic di-GMP-binding protein [Gammaproteobacteria bacterium]|nr:YajQ family cyclic di-GMP-binding protein [Gammaproteobacteria bacterium]